MAADILHFNASFPNAWGSDATTALRASDHDPLEGRFSLNSVSDAEVDKNGKVGGKNAKADDEVEASRTNSDRTIFLPAMMR